MYLLKLAMRPWKVAPISQTVTIFAVGFLLFLSGFLLSLQQGLRPLIARLHNEQVITAYIDSASSPKEEERIVDTLKTQLGAKAQISVFTSNNFIDEIRNEYPELSRELEDLGGEVTTIVPRYVSVSGFLPDTALASVKSVSGIESAESSINRYSHIVGAFKTLHWLVGLLSLGLCFSLLAGLIQLSKINSFVQADALSILRLWGAGHLTLKMPRILTSLTSGGLGGLVAGVAWLLAAPWLNFRVKALSPMFADIQLPQLQLAIALFLIGVVLGLLAGAFSGRVTRNA